MSFNFWDVIYVTHWGCNRCYKPEFVQVGLTVYSIMKINEKEVIVLSQETAPQSLVDQVEDLYEEKERLQEELGISSIDEAIKMIRSLQDQVEALYEQKDATR